MPSVTRSDVQRHVYELLRRGDFRKKMKVRDADGSHPIVVAVPSDHAADVLDEVSAIGGRANLIVPLADGLAVCSVEMDSPTGPSLRAAAESLAGDCTIGVFLARVVADGGEGRYGFVMDRPGQAHGTAALTGVSG